MKDTPTDFAVHPPTFSFPRLEVLEPLEDQIHLEEPKVTVQRITYREVYPWEADILARHGWELCANGTSQTAA
jgi:hypothetical protein